MKMDTMNFVFVWLTRMVGAGHSFEKECSGKEDHGEHVRRTQRLPPVQQGADKVTKELLEVQIAVLRYRAR